MRKVLCFSFWLLLTAAVTTAQARAPYSLSGELVQGGLVIGQTDPKAKVTLNGRKLRVSPSGKFVFGFHRDYKKKTVLDVRLPDGSQQKQTLKIATRTYKTQHIRGLKKGMVTPSKKALERIRQENRQIGIARANNSPQAWFESGFIWPVKGIVTGVYGSRRVLNGQPRRPHYGIDVAAPAGTPVVSMSDGKVTMAAKDLYFTGGTIIIDHGHGLSSTYSHMLAVDVKVGQLVKQGERIGTVGSTGRSTGPHLDWRVNWFRERLDPALLVPPMPAMAKKRKK